MSELRWNPLLGEWVITATHRQDRTYHPPADYCPLCPTLPGKMETEISLPDFNIAVFENKFPSLQPRPPRPVVRGDRLHPVQPSLGDCEVVVYTPRHDSTLAAESEERIYHLLQVWQARFRELGARKEVKYVLIFENKGEVIGVTLSHPHGQIYAFPFIPPIPKRELAAFRKYWRSQRRCLLCHTLAGERRRQSRMVLENESFAAYVPFAARYPYEVHLLPRRHVADILSFTEPELLAWAQALKRLLAGFDRLFGFSFPYMMLLHQRPTDGRSYPDFHFHMEFLPPHRSATRLKYLAGCESGAGTFINDTLAEEKAAELRRAIQSAQHA